MNENITGYRYMFGLAAIPSAIQLVGFMFLPESPRWLVTNGYQEKAVATLSRIRGNTDIEQEMKEIRDSCQTSYVLVANIGPLFYKQNTNKQKSFYCRILKAKQIFLYINFCQQVFFNMIATIKKNILLF